ncbi:hypothetical protein MASR2M78_01460 [Treponema sp.]
MAIDKDPSIYRDRSTIGSSDELDEYGVWVKSEPQDISGSSNVEEDSIEPSLPDMEDLPDLELGSDEDFDFSMDEEISLDAKTSLDPDISTDDVPYTPSLAKEELSLEVETIDSSLESLPSFEEISSFEEDALEALPDQDDFTELSMDDFLDADDQEEDVLPALEANALDIDLDFNDTDSPVLTSKDFRMEDLASSSEEAAPETVGLETVSDFDDFLNELSDDKSSTIKAETIDPDISDAFDVELSSSGGSEEVELPESSFDDVDALSRDLQVESSPTEPRIEENLSTQLLMRIAEELSSIKTELSSLKNELTVLRGAAIPSKLTLEEQEENAKGFFDEEDDEKIALTGDELDNILNTADFTEESGSDATDLFEEEGAIEFLSDKEDLLGDEELDEPIVEEAPIEDISLDEIIAAGEDSDTNDVGGAIESIELDDSLLDDEELKDLRENGVQIMTEAPEDTSYLEGDNVNLDLSEAVIEEPDLSGIMLEEAPVEEPSIDTLHIDLDAEEELHIESQEELEVEVEEAEEEEELSLGPIESFDDFSEPKLESFEEVLPEGFIVDAEGSEGPDLSSDIESLDMAEEPLLDEETEIEAALPEEEALSEPETLSPEETETPLPANLRQEVKTVLSYMDQLLESLPEEKIEEFAKSEYFNTYKKLFEELGLV